MHKLIVEDSTQCFTAMPDYVLIFKKRGENTVPVEHPQGLSEYFGETPILPAMQEKYGTFEQIEKKIAQALEQVGIVETKIEISYPTNSDFGDYTTNVALQIAKKLHRNPFELAQEIASHIPSDDVIQKVQVIQPGFINF